MSIAHRVVAGIAAAAFAFALSACAGGGGGGGNVATVNGQAITHAQLDSQLESSPTARNVLQTLVTNDLIDQYAQQHHITVTQAEINNIEDQYKKQYPNGEWDELLKMRGFTEKDVQDLIRRQIILDKAVGSNTKITQAQVVSYFQKNHAQFDKPPMVRARHILVPDMKTAQKVEAELKAGKNFAAVAKQYSTDPGSRAQGGELGWFRQGQMQPAFDKYAFSGPVGAISPPIKTVFGYHIIQVEDRKPGQKATLASTEDQIRQQLRQQQDAPLFPAFLQQLQAQANIQIADQKFAGLFPSPPPSMAPATAPSASPAAAPTKK
jgi:foldase protein PrsA